MIVVPDLRNRKDNWLFQVFHNYNKDFAMPKAGMAKFIKKSIIT